MGIERGDFLGLLGDPLVKGAEAIGNPRLFTLGGRKWDKKRPYLREVQALPIASGLNACNLFLPELRNDILVKKYWTKDLLYEANEADMLVYVAANNS